MKFVSMDAALDLLMPGTRLFLPGSTAEPATILDAQAVRQKTVVGVEAITGFVSGLNRFDRM